MEIFYIEDNPDNTLLIQRIVKAEGHSYLFDGHKWQKPKRFLKEEVVQKMLKECRDLNK